MHTSYYQVILFSGTDRQAFLQGQLTQDLDNLQVAISLPAALCNAKGRVVANCRLLHLGDRIGMVVPTAMVATVSKRLALYVLRSDVQISCDDDNQVAAAFSDENSLRQLAETGLLPDAKQGACKRLNNLVAVNQAGTKRYVEIYGLKDAIPGTGLDPTNALNNKSWQQERVASGLVDIVTDNSEQYTPHMLNLDLTGAISFSKGCYTGQEVVARTEHLGSVKRRINRYRLITDTTKIGDKLSAEDRDIGTVVNVASGEILAVTPVTHHKETLRLGKELATPLPLPYQIA